MLAEDVVQIKDVAADSIAAELGIEAGDKLLKINGEVIRDYIDYKFWTTDLYLEVLVEKSNGQQWLLEIEKDYDQDLGIELPGIIYDGLNKCENNCIFCFVDQSPEGLRETLTFKDDDYRFSFLEGSYITLSNLNQEDFKRIKQFNLSPLYVSVHTTNPQLRVQMLGNKQAANILAQLKELAGAGIEFHTQIVLCPGINDGAELERSITDLLELESSLRSLAIVPVGLTKFRDNLFQLRSVTALEAAEVIDSVSCWQERLKQRLGRNFIYLADEFYLLADYPLPTVEEYNGFPQLENGVGLIRFFWHEFSELEAELPAALTDNKSFSIVTSSLGAQALEPVVSRLNETKGLDIKLLVVENRFFGKEVTVTGLLTAQDIIAALKEGSPEKKVVLSTVMLNQEGLFIDDYSLADLKAEFPELDFIVVENKAATLINRLLNQYGGVVNEQASSSDCG
ncbi:DUF512 domain-containing protein [Fuchsiella alkaliacetigena]|uniref:DUF512 domain-containing protein n=1 Tax=Fuchsiella alkaliacetigena TaxID=957042 RepID=UPI00200B0E2C|nr:DUF512 domain-containing protein [Fuchsiella alkaliacetigena]MCK8823928.1 DUF512 domain-containing protein [Fuchsiella alkaliacetigena]